MDSSLSALHVLHRLRIRLCWQMLPPPHSLHSLLLRACWQMLPPPHALHVLLIRLCWQMLPPPARVRSFLADPPGRLGWRNLDLPGASQIRRTRTNEPPRASRTRKTRADEPPRTSRTRKTCASASLEASDASGLTLVLRKGTHPAP